MTKTNIENIMINPYKLRVCCCIGKGTFGRVLLMKDTSQGKRLPKAYAIKEVNKSKLVHRNDFRQMTQESRILEHIKGHPFLIKCHATWQDKKKVYILMDFINGYELYNLMKTEGALPEAQVQQYAAEIITALDFLHKNGIIYHDLKPENIMIDREGHIVLIDFGLSRTANKDNELRVRTACGTPEYLAPEILRQGSHGKAVDYWALGTIVFEMLYQFTPFYDYDRNQMFFNILYQRLRFPKREEFLNYPRSFTRHSPISDACKDFMKGLLHRNETKRLGSGDSGFENITYHPFLAKLDFQTVLARKLKPEYIPEVLDEFDISNFDECFTREQLQTVEEAKQFESNMFVPGFERIPQGCEMSWYMDTIERKENIYDKENLCTKHNILIDSEIFAK